MQCKQYASKVENAAVQEVIAGIEYVRENIGIVVATEGFTVSAIKLAERIDVLLCSHVDLHNINGLVKYIASM